MRHYRNHQRHYRRPRHRIFLCHYEIINKRIYLIESQKSCPPFERSEPRRTTGAKEVDPNRVEDLERSL